MTKTTMMMIAGILCAAAALGSCDEGMQMAMTYVPEEVEEIQKEGSDGKSSWGDITEDDIALVTGGGSGSSGGGGVWRVNADAAGGLVSKGLASGSAKTYFIDYDHGNDDYPGTAPHKAWKSFKNINDGREFKPGDHILLEANSTWNGETVTPANYKTLLKSDTVAMMAPKGSGEPGKPIVIDLYEVETWQDAPTPSEPVVIKLKADKRPILNGNGTPSTDYTNPYNTSGPVTLIDVHDWEVRNLEITNTFETNFDSSTDHWYRRGVPKALVGIIVDRVRAADSENIVIANCYVHDVQSAHNNNGAGGHISQNYFPEGAEVLGKGNGGIIAVSGTNLLMEGNIVRRVGLEGLRTAGAVRKADVVIRGNFIDTVAGDGIVIARVEKGGLVESNIVKDACAAPNLGTGNYASNWCYIANDTIFRYNEGYGTRYGYLDGEAFDVDNDSARVIYEYNYSHWNAGGACLFMGSQQNSVFRYNISANDGGGTRAVKSASEFNPPDYDESVWNGATSYVRWEDGQTTFHYTTKESSGANCPLIYNNTFYVGPDISVGLFGHNDGNRASINYVRFYNNIVLKERGSSDSTIFATTSSGDPGGSKRANFTGYLKNPDGVKNNIFWAYVSGAPGTNVEAAFSNGSKGMNDLIGKNGNQYKNPNLVIQQSGKLELLKKQRRTALPPEALNDAEKLAQFTGRKRLQSRASLFAPVSGSIGGGLATPKTSSVSAMDSAWNDCDEVAEDFFGNTVSPGSPPIGAASGTFKGAAADDPWAPAP
ncbi:MAG: right-handed parallel beta-helix repeat-containing protein [Treponema sp.]|nr:right-handed parallel beta-helix repeat-containing protein [Treponema sp.]